MRQRLAVAALGAALLTSSAWAQRRGGGGFAGHAGFASHGPVGGAHAPMASPGFSPRAAYWGRGSGSWSRPNGWGYARNGPYSRGYPYSPYRRYYRWGNYGGWYGYPGWGLNWAADDWYPSQSSAYYEYPPDTYAQEQQEEMDRLNDEVARLREGRQAQRAPKPEATDVREQTDLIYRDQHTEQIENYAIVGQTLWVFNQQRSRKVALADLDIAATKTANEARGVEFSLPR